MNNQWNLTLLFFSVTQNDPLSLLHWRALWKTGVPLIDLDLWLYNCRRQWVEKKQIGENCVIDQTLFLKGVALVPKQLPSWKPLPLWCQSTKQQSPPDSMRFWWRTTLRSRTCSTCHTRSKVRRAGFHLRQWPWQMQLKPTLTTVTTLVYWQVNIVQEGIYII